MLEPLSPHETFEILEGIREEWADCTKCPLHRLRRSVVVYGIERFGSDDDELPFEPLLVLGEAPGEQEDLRGEPFVGPSGKVLREAVLVPAGARDVIISNACACRPPKNRQPEDAEIDKCAPRLVDITQLCGIRGVLFVGRTTQAASGRITDVSGRSVFADLPQAHIIHPSYILRNGWPRSKRSLELVAQSVGTVRRLLDKMAEVARAQGEGRGSEGASGEAAGGEAHAHDFSLEVGHWTGPERFTRIPIRACACGVVDEPKLERKTRRTA